MESANRDLWCCLGRLCDAKSCMQLPPGIVCGACEHFPLCCHDTDAVETSNYCQWFPRRFSDKARSPISTYIRVTVGGACCICTLEDALIHTADWYDATNGELLKMELAHMSRSEYEARREFEES